MWIFYGLFLLITWPIRYWFRKKFGSKDFTATTGEEYEQKCCKQLKRKGFYGIETTPRTGDHGIDIIAYGKGKKYAIQCKFYSSAVGNHAVQEAYSGCEY